MSTVTARGTAVARTAPDEASLELSVEALRPSPGEALADVATRAETLVALCDELGIAPERRVTTGATVGEQVEHDREGRRQHRGYLAVSRLLVRVEEATVAGRLLAESVERADARVAGPWWTVAPDNPARLQACRDAALDARRKAEAYAAALGARLGAIVAVREPGTRGDWPPEPRGIAARAMLAEPSAPQPAVEAGELAVSASVEVEWALEQG